MFIAHELNELTRSYLINNTIDVIINQDIRHEVFSAIELIVRHKKQESIELSVRQPRVATLGIRQSSFVARRSPS